VEQKTTPASGQQSGAPSVPSAPTFFSRHEFIIKRLFSLAGIVPVGAYMVVHLATNASLGNSVSTFQNAVYSIHGLGKLLPVVEWVFIFIPILFHAFVGLWIIRGAQPNPSVYPLSANVRYTLQRATGLIGFLFILWHVFQMHGWIHFSFFEDNIVAPLGGGRFRPYNAGSSLAMTMQSPIVVALYAIGVGSLVFHLANGLWTAGITWGLWTAPAAQKRAGKVCAGFGVILAVVALGALVAPLRVDPAAAQKVEDEMYEANVKSHRILPSKHKRLHASDRAAERAAERALDDQVSSAGSVAR
jgi:succinate dehydrogenase / fumarate reductase cytochrome b subunit